MPLRNRVTPAGDIIAVTDRGLFLGNRGILHDSGHNIIRDHQHQRWLTCTLSYRGRRRPIMAPGTYTELFFLDEAVALAAGHRPCAKCRPASYRRYRSALADTVGYKEVGNAEQIDHRLAAERRRLHPMPDPVDALPDGSFVTDCSGETFYLLWQQQYWRWSPAGYLRHDPDIANPRLVTPPTHVLLLRNGYVPVVHSSVGAW